MLGLGAIAGIQSSTPANTSRQAQVNELLQNTKPASSPASAPTSVVQVTSLLPMKLYRQTMGQGRVWQGIEKRGNRKGRSRFNYNR